MTEQDPKQVIIDYITRPPGVIQSNASPPPGIALDKWRPGIVRSGGGLGAKPETICFLQQRNIPHHQLHEVTFENEEGEVGHWLCFVMHNEQGQWQFTGGGSVGEVKHVLRRDHPWANLAGSWGREFWTGGRVYDNELDVERVRMVAANGGVLEDVVQDGVVMFVTDQEFQIPSKVELYDRSGNMVGTHTFPQGPLPIPQ